MSRASAENNEGSDPPTRVGSASTQLPAGDDGLAPETRARLARRDPEALAEFYETWFDRLYGYVRRLLGEDHLAEDLTQDIFMHVYKSLPSYDPSRELRPWVFTIATNKVRDFWRSRRFKDTQREAALEEDERGGVAVSSGRGPLEVLANQELGDTVTQAIEALPEGMRTTFVLRYFEGLSFEAIGDILGRNEAAVRKRYSRALEELRHLLRNHSESPSDGPTP